MEHLILEIGIVIVSAAVVAVILYYLKQPLILAYILAGIFIGPFGFWLISKVEFIHGIAGVGIILMLFLVWLEMNTSKLKDLWLVALITGIGQVVFTGVTGFIIVKMFWFTTIQSMYLAVALTFSSTVIAVKLMSDQKSTKSLYGQICIGILIIQDILAIMALLILTGFQEGSFSFDFLHFVWVFIKGIVLTIASIFIAKKILKYIYNKIASSQELLVLFSLSWCFFIALISMKIGFSMEIWAFIAGISLANLPYTFEINVKTKILRDFFITIFFVSLGTGLIFSSIWSLILPLIVLCLFVLVGNPIIILVLMGIMGYDKRTAFFTWLNIANISEFSLIVIALWFKLKHLDETITSMAAIIAIVTMVLSSYMITYNHVLYRYFQKYLSIFEFRKKKGSSQKRQPLLDHIIILWCGRMGEQVLEQVLSFKDDYIVVDHDNQTIKNLMDKNINCIFGDIDNEELLESLDIKDAEIIISTLPNSEDNYFLLKYLENMDPENKPIVIAIANSWREGMEIFNRWVDYVILKHHLGAKQIHQVNKEIYQISEDLKHISLSKNIKHNISPKTNEIIYEKLNDDHQVAKLLHNLNKLRLDEIKHKIKKKDIIVKTKFK